MSDEIRLAFAHPLERACVPTAATDLDRISVRDYTVSVEIGAFQKERGVEQRLRFNVVVEVKAADAVIDDDVDRILSYDTITEAIDTELAAERLNLLETLAERIAGRVLNEPLAARVFVRVEKLDRGPGNLGVEIVRSAQARPQRSVQNWVKQPRVVFLSNRASQSDRLSQWLDEITAESAPVIFCLGLPDAAPMVASTPSAQWVIDLLTIDQNAWRFAARDPRCFVVATKTELDWSMKNGQIAVWAPSKMILDAVMPPIQDATAASEFAIWLAGMINAHDVVMVDHGVEGAAARLPLDTPSVLA